jgi:hypothetical protein
VSKLAPTNSQELSLILLFFIYFFVKNKEIKNGTFRPEASCRKLSCLVFATPAQSTFLSGSNNFAEKIFFLKNVVFVKFGNMSFRKLGIRKYVVWKLGIQK